MAGSPRCGDVIRVDGASSVQFAGGRALLMRVLRVSDRPTYCGWMWLTGYVVDRKGQAVERREIFVQTDGVRILRPATAEAAKRLYRQYAGSQR